MEESQIKQIIEQQPLHGSALLDPRCKILLLVCIGFVSYFLAGEVVSLALMLVYGLFIAVGNGGKWALKMIVAYIIVAYLNALLRYVQVPVLSVIMSVFGVTLLKLIPIVMMGPLDFADYLHGRPDGGAPADAASPGGDDPAGGHVPLYPHPADRIPADPQHHGHPGDQRYLVETGIPSSCHH